jgi:hypothetical protein
VKTNGYEIFQLAVYLIMASVFLYLAITDGGVLRWVAGIFGAIAFVAKGIAIVTRK